MQWILAFAGNLLTALAAGTVSYLLLRSADVQGPDKLLPFGTALVFFTIAGNHGARALQVLYPWLGIDDGIAEAAHIQASHWPVWVTTLVLAATALFYLRWRGRYGSLLHGAALYEDLHQDHRRALGLHDTVVQSLTQAAWALDLGQSERAREALEQALEHAQRIGQEPAHA